MGYNKRMNRWCIYAKCLFFLNLALHLNNTSKSRVCAFIKRSLPRLLSHPPSLISQIDSSPCLLSLQSYSLPPEMWAKEVRRDTRREETRRLTAQDIVISFYSSINKIWRLAQLHHLSIVLLSSTVFYDLRCQLSLSVIITAFLFWATFN